MNMIKVYYFFTLLLPLSIYSFNAKCEDVTHDHHEEVTVSNVGSDKGVLEASESKGLKLTAEAIKTLEIETKTISGTNQIFSIPRGALVESKTELFVYTLANGFYKGLEVAVLKKTKDSIDVKFEEKIESSLNVVTKGAGFLRNIQVDVFSGEEEGGHHH